MAQQELKNCPPFVWTCTLTHTHTITMISNHLYYKVDCNITFCFLHHSETWNQAAAKINKFKFQLFQNNFHSHNTSYRPISRCYSLYSRDVTETYLFSYEFLFLVFFHKADTISSLKNHSPISAVILRSTLNLETANKQRKPASLNPVKADYKYAGWSGYFMLNRIRTIHALFDELHPRLQIYN